jgi:hypothetical protein
MKLLSKELLKEYGFVMDMDKSDSRVALMRMKDFEIIIKEGGNFYYSNLGIDYPLKDLAGLRKLFKEVKGRDLKVIENC